MKFFFVVYRKVWCVIWAKMKKFEITFPLIWLILLLKPEFRAADYRAMLDKKGKLVHEYYYTFFWQKVYNICMHYTICIQNSSQGTFSWVSFRDLIKEYQHKNAKAKYIGLNSKKAMFGRSPLFKLYFFLKSLFWTYV